MSISIFKEPSDTSFLSESRSVGFVGELPYSLVVQNVIITPGHMHFNNAYEGKSYKKKLTIQNCGKRQVFIRLSEANSSFKPFIDGTYLSPGLRIVREVNYTYTRALGTLKGFAKLWVNEEKIEYQFVVTLSRSIFTVKPQVLDFGKINAVNRADTCTFTIRNDGFKDGHFSIDLGRNHLLLNVYPVRGVVPAKSSVTISVEIIGSHDGEFIQEFWIKANPPLRVVVTGIFISPKLLVRKFINSFDFTLRDFPPTYYGSSCTQPLLIKNFSSSNSMFCVLAEINGCSMTLKEAREIDDNYKNFIIKPTDGRLAAQKGALIQLTFAPIKVRTKDKNYAACFLKVIRMDCRDVDDDKIYNEPVDESGMSQATVESSLTKDENVVADRVPLYESPSFDEDGSEVHFSFESSIKVCIYGEKLNSGVILRPTALHLNELTLHQCYQREIKVTNISLDLPITVRYNKVASVDVVPSEFVIAPTKDLEVLVIIRPSKLSAVTKKVTFDLLQRDYPFDSKVIRKVGSACLHINVETTEIVKKQSLKQCILCENLPSKLEPSFPFKFTESRQAQKKENYNFYVNYLGSLRKMHPEDEESKEYAITNSSLIKRENYKCQKPIPKGEKVKRITPFVPLIPSLLYNIKITPKSLRIRKVTAFTTIIDHFHIENLNTFPIRVYVKSTKPCIVFDNFSRYVINSKQKKKITFSFHTSTIGRYYVSINVLINDSALYEITAVAHVVPKTLKINSDDIVFEEKDAHCKFIRLINYLNAPATFDWDIPKGCFQIYPKNGGIRAERSILCALTFTPDPGQPKAVECALTPESGYKKIVTITSKPRSNLVIFDSHEIDVGLIPLNVPVYKKVVVRNLKNFTVNYSILFQIAIPGINIEPTEGMLEGLDSQVFKIAILLKAVIQFETDITFFIDETEYKVNLRGSVEYPKFVLTPSALFFRKISPHSYDTLAFKAKNLSESEITVTFPADELPEFTITELEFEPYPHQEKLILAGKQAKILYLHYHPLYVSTYSSNLCYVINDILAAMFVTSNVSTTVKHILEKYTTIYEGIPGVVIKTTPNLLSTLRINSFAVEKKIKFSTLNINLIYFGEGHYNNKTTSDFIITNISTETVTICVRTDDLRLPFYLIPKKESYIEYYDVSYKIVLDPGEQMPFEISFEPLDIGEYVVKLPIFLRHYYDNKMFNYLTIKGIYDKPTISSSMERCMFAPVPYRITNKLPLTLRFENHFGDCEVSVNSNKVHFLYVSFTNGSKPQTGVSYLTVVIMCQPARTKCFDTILEFMCSCNATFTIPVTGVTENCLLTTHAYLYMLQKSLSPLSAERYIRVLENNQQTCYPLFPNDDCIYGLYMRNLQKTLENWIFSQAFYMKSYYRIPEGFSDFCKLAEPWEKLMFGGYRKPKKNEDLPLLQLVMNLAGPQIREKLAESLPDTNDEHVWLIYTSQTISKILYYLRGFSIFLPHVRTKYLLNYEQYIAYEKIKHPNYKCMDETTFYRLSKQCYVDLILQIIKTFVLLRTTPLSETSGIDKTAISSPGRRFSLMSKNSSTSEESGECVFEIGIYSPHEIILIDWLFEIFNSEKATLWKQPPKDKEMCFLDENLRDGLMLGAVTAHYCPYVRTEIHDMYSNPQSPEEFHHNACTLINTWKMLNLSYVIMSRQFETYSSTEMLLLVLYLYDVLPNYLPNKTITIEAPLTQTNSKTVDLRNLGDDTIVYRVVFFGNEAKLFHVSHNIIKIPPGIVNTIVVQYYAKIVHSTTVTILFSGETPGQKYGKSIAITLVGVSDVSYACMEIPLTVELYKSCTFKLHLTSPFKTAAEYSLYFGYSKYSQEKHSLFPWEEIKNLKIIREFILEDEVCKFDEDGECITTQTVCCQEVGPRDIWFYFTNPDVGDWGIKITLEGKVTQHCYEQIDVYLPKTDKSLVCRCKNKLSVTKNCPMILHVMIPMINHRLWNARKAIVLCTTEGRELQFWSKRIYTPSGIRILKLVLNSETHPMRQVITERVKYKVNLDKPAPFVTLDYVVFEDVTSEDFYNLPIHPLKNVDLLQIRECNLRLISADKRERRFYTINFIRNEPNFCNTTQ